jgi:phosphoribosylanthranilate isomerase
MAPASPNPHVIKVCGVTSEDDALAAVEAGASAIGLNFYPRSSRCVNLNQASKISEALPKSVLRLGVFVNPALEELFRIAGETRLNVVQIHGVLPPDLSGLRVWRAIPVDTSFSTVNVEESAAFEAFLLDSPVETYGGSGRTFDWVRVRNVTARFVLAGGLDASNVEEAISVAKPWGVDACSRLESAPGRKDRKKMCDFVRAAERGFRALEEVADLVR